MTGAVPALLIVPADRDTKGSYMHPLFATPLGLAMVIGAVVLVVVGTVWMRNVVKVEV